MKYYNYQITTSEIPGEITLCINITNCPIHCPNCHSKFLWEDIGQELNYDETCRILEESKGVSCVCVMGGDGDYYGIRRLFSWIHQWSQETNNPVKLALYSGRPDLATLKNLTGNWINRLDFIKVGHYIEEKGGLDNPNTNQRLYQKIDDNFLDITSRFWVKDF